MSEEMKNDTTDIYAMLYKQYLLSEPWWALLISGIVTLAFGAIVIAWPLMTLSIWIISFGILAIVLGVFSVIRSLFLIKKNKNWWILLIEGILGIVIGIMVFTWSISTTISLVHFIEPWLIITGITTIVHGSTAKNTSLLAMGFLSLILGIFMFFSPHLYSTETLILFIGLFTVFRGLAMIVYSIEIVVAQKRAKRTEF